MSHKSQSIKFTRYESKRIYNQRRIIKKLEERIKELEYENYIKSKFIDLLTANSIDNR